MPFLLLGLLIIIDQIVKVYISSTLLLGTSLPVLPGIFHITYIHNPGAAFGILANQRQIFILFSIILFVLSAYFYRRLKMGSICLKYGATMLVGGAIGNLIDRIRFGYVIDFFDFRIWPVFNIADIAICIGVGLLMYYVVFEMEETE